MRYILVNIDSGEPFFCEGEGWPSMLASARERGWEPEGTRYDFFRGLEDHFDEGDDEMGRLFTLIQVNDRLLGWDGNYLDKENQVVTEDDAWNLRSALRLTPVKDDILRFLGKGSFRIAAD